MHHSYALQCYDQTHQTNTQVNVTMVQNARKLTVNFTLYDPLGLVEHALTVNTNNHASPAHRAHELWKKTCFEVFIQSQDSTAYHELNFSTNGQWNVYAFEGYRDPSTMPPRQEEQPLLIELTTTLNGVCAVIDLSFFKLNPELRLGLSAVIQHKNGQQHYWALQHTAAQADFHHSNDWVIPIVVGQNK